MEPIEVNGQLFNIDTITKEEHGRKVMTFSTTVEGIVYELKATITEDLIEDLKRVCGLDPEEELKDIIRAELVPELKELLA